ncbi:MAG: helix-turn-helix domain-containing protein, partial [Dehalococcoidia bacterium]
YNRTVAFEDVFGPDARALLEQLRAAASWEARFSILDRALTARLAEAPAPSTEVARAWCRLQRTNGCLDIGTLAAELGWSRKHLIARFREQIGLPPKTLARILRFNRAVRLLNRNDTMHWTAIAHDCGYYDQAHLIRDFRQFAGTTPGDFLRRRLPDGGGVIGA